MRHHLTLVVVAVSSFLAACKTPMSGGSALRDDPPREDTSYHALGVRPDCTEQPLTFDQVLEIAKNVPPGADGQQAFLDALPKGAMQTFTLQYESESAQADGVSAEFPGIVRMTQDGLVTIRYTCNRAVPSVYGKVEVLHFDEKKKKFGFTELNFKSQDPAKRIAREPAKCYGCHNINDAVEDARPNWAMYPEWPGAFGSHDDFFPAGTEDEAALVSHAPGWLPPDRSEEYAIYKAFLTSKVIGGTDPCYASLPWPEPWRTGEAVPAELQNYPYGTKNGNAKTRIYALRPNLKFSEIYSKLLAQRNFRKLKEHPIYDSFKALLALEAASCTEERLDIWSDEVANVAFAKSELDAQLTEVLPTYKRAADETPQAVELRGRTFPHHDPRHPASRAQALYGVWRALEWDGGEWTLVPFEYFEPQYETGAGPGANREFPADLPLTAYVQQQLLADVLGDATDGLSRSTGEADDFGEHFACIDRQGGAKVFESLDAWRETCEALKTMAMQAPRDLPRPGPRPPGRRLPKPKRADQDLDDYLRYLKAFD